MSQSDLNIANQAGAAFRADVNAALQALGSLSEGITEPTTTYPYQPWVDTSLTPSLLKFRNGANSAWITFGAIADSSALSFWQGGAQRMTILSSNGFVGISDATPSYELDVDGDINVTGDFLINGTPIGTIADDSITYAKMQNAGANTVLCRAAGTTGDLGEIALTASKLLGRGSTGNVASITLGTGLSMAGTTLNVTITGAGRLLAMTVFSSPGTWTKATLNPSFVIVEAVGPGGNGSAGGGGGGAGGGGGGYARKKILAASLGSTEAVTIGSPGSPTTFGSHVTCNTGSPGASNGSVNGASEGGSGGDATGGDINLRGNPGGNGYYQSVQSGAGAGGASALGGGGLGRGTNGAGIPADANTGGGGGGGVNSGGGGAGGTGLVIVWEYS